MCFEGKKQKDNEKRETWKETFSQNEIYISSALSIKIIQIHYRAQERAVYNKINQLKKTSDNVIIFETFKDLHNHAHYTKASILIVMSFSEKVQ